VLGQLFKRLIGEKGQPKKVVTSEKKRNTEKVAVRKGVLGEYKIDIQLDQLSNEYLHLSDLMVENSRSKTGYSQIDHVIITPYGFIVIETKNYQGTIYGGRDRKTWLVNGKFKMMNPLIQNYGHIQALKSYVDNPHQELFYSFVTFTKRCTLKVDLELLNVKSYEVVLYDLKLTEYVNRKLSMLKLIHKQPLLTPEEMQKVFESFSSANITDPSIREMHIALLKEKNIQLSTSQQYKCSVCGKPVSDKVKKYCDTVKRFNGEIFCYEHQRNSAETTSK
jgi:hypothetical protein